MNAVPLKNTSIDSDAYQARLQLAGLTTFTTTHVLMRIPRRGRGLLLAHERALLTKLLFLAWTQGTPT